MSYSRITVFGGTGFLGRQIVRRLAADGADVRVAVRHPERASFLAKAGKAGQITTVYADVWNEASVGPAVNGAEAVVNTVGQRPFYFPICSRTVCSAPPRSKSRVVTSGPSRPKDSSTRIFPRLFVAGVPCKGDDRKFRARP